MSSTRTALTLSATTAILLALSGLLACGGGSGFEGAPAGGLARPDERGAVLTRAQIERINASSMEQLLSGRFTGLRITRDSTGATRLRIRTLDADPLIVLDGVPGLALGSLWQLNPNDIEEIRVLRESATAIYGMDGIGGVLMINTRRR